MAPVQAEVLSASGPRPVKIPLPVFKNFWREEANYWEVQFVVGVGGGLFVTLGSQRVVAVVERIMKMRMRPPSRGASAFALKCECECSA